MYHPSVYISIYIVIVGNDAFPSSLQINKSNTLLARRFSFFLLLFLFIIVYRERKTSNDTIIECKYIYGVAFFDINLAYFP